MYCYTVMVRCFERRSGSVGEEYSASIYGTHSSLKKAKDHVGVIIKDRQQRADFEQCWQNDGFGDTVYRTMLKTNIPSLKSLRTEIIEIEKWKLWEN